ncbi:hypothetical protein AAFO90_24495 [Phaeobacter sp. CAU 1743]|uniref:hypothetical protein n=1 Tax=Phaeobacter sp. CAU 1743 TaxID=3140367 RepID=UPI00325B3C66
MSYVMAPRPRPLLTPPNDGTQMENKLDLRVALKKGAGQPTRLLEVLQARHFRVVAPRSGKVFVEQLGPP